MTIGHQIEGGGREFLVSGVRVLFFFVPLSSTFLMFISLLCRCDDEWRFYAVVEEGNLSGYDFGRNPEHSFY